MTLRNTTSQRFEHSLNTAILNFLLISAEKGYVSNLDRRLVAIAVSIHGTRPTPTT